MNQVKVIERNNQRVLTSLQLAEAYETDIKSIQKNFSRNKSRYTQGKHYFVLTGEELKEFKTDHQIDGSLKKVNTLYLWTQKGALHHAKSLGADKAWEAYEALVDDYFNKTEQLQRAQIPSPVPQTLEDIMIAQLMSMKELKTENEKLRREMSHLSLVVDNEIILTKQQRAEIQQAVRRRQGELNREGYDHPHFKSIYTAVNDHFNVPSYNEIKRTDFEQALKVIAGWYPKKKDDIA
jgi:phage regulator Rha-like protein